MILMENYFVIANPSSQYLARNIAKKLPAKFLKTTLKVFPDGESKLTILGNVKKGTIIVVSSTGPPVDSNILRTLLLISKSREMSKKVITVIPYLGYAKQDKEFLKGEIVTISVIAKLLKNAGATHLVVADFHSKEALNFFQIPTKNITALSKFVEYFHKYTLKDPLIVSPDLFWKANAMKFAKQLNGSVLSLNKQRDRRTGKLFIKSAKEKFSTKRDLILFDDMVSSGGTILKAIQFLERRNFRNVYVACTHPVFSVGATRKIKKAGVTEIIGTNSIEGEFSKIDLSDIICKEIKNW